MKQTKLMKQALALILALMLGLSALGGIVMAFAQEPDERLPEPTTEATVDVPVDEDWETVLFDESVTEAVLRFEERATLTLKPDDTLLWLGWNEQYTPAMDQLGLDNLATFDVMNFVFITKLDTPGTMTITTQNPYLYRYTGGVATPIQTVYENGIHTFQTDTLDCFLASNVKLG